METKEQVLQACTVEGSLVRLPGVQLDRKLYLDVAKALEMIGGKWNRKSEGFVFASDPAPLLAQIANGHSRNLKKEFQFFETPAPVADYLVKLANPKEGSKILEPSAGQGAIIDAIMRYIPGQKCIDYCELLKVNRDILEKRYPTGLGLWAENLLVTEEDLPYKWDYIIANPPFSKNQDIDHIRKMYALLAPGGRMVSVASRHWCESSKKKESEFRKWLIEVEAHMFDLPAGAFKESGTEISALIILINKPAQAINKAYTPVDIKRWKQRKQNAPDPVKTHLAIKADIMAQITALIKQAIPNEQAFNEYLREMKPKNEKERAKMTADFIIKSDMNDTGRDQNGEIVMRSGNAVYKVKNACDLPCLLHSIKYNWGNGTTGAPATTPFTANIMDAQALKLQSGTPASDPEPPVVQSSSREVVQSSRRAVVPSSVSSLILVKYSPKSFALFGPTKPIKDKLWAMGGRPNPGLHHNSRRTFGWVFPLKCENQLRDFIGTSAHQHISTSAHPAKRPHCNCVGVHNHKKKILAE